MENRQFGLSLLRLLLSWKSRVQRLLSKQSGAAPVPPRVSRFAPSLLSLWAPRGPINLQLAEEEGSFCFLSLC